MIKYLSKQKDIFKTHDVTFIKTLLKSNDRFTLIEGLINFDAIAQTLTHLYPKNGAPSIEVERSLRILIVQYLQDISDREMEDLLLDSLRTKYFCKYDLEEKVPDHSHLSRFRKRLGVETVQSIFNQINDQLNRIGLIGHVFSFIDGSSIKAKEHLWKERDKAIQEGEKLLNNAVVAKHAKDKEARIGSKGKDNFWFGYKRHVEVDMRHGIILNAHVTPANILDHQAIDPIVPENKIVYMDKGYDTKRVDELLESHGSEPATIRMKNSKKADAKASAYRSKLRMPFESTFSKCSKKTRYRGLEKTMIQVFLESIAHNLKKGLRYATI